MAVNTVVRYKRSDPISENWGTEDGIVTYGYGTFTTSGTTAELEVDQATIDFVHLTPKVNAYDVDDLLFCDGVVSSGAITVTRDASGTSGLDFWYMVIGPTTASSS